MFFFEGWFADVVRSALELGAYFVAELEQRCVVEHKDLPDLIHSPAITVHWLETEDLGRFLGDDDL